MAAHFVPVVRNHHDFEEDPDCRYSYFHHKPDGQIASVAIGDRVAVGQAEAVGITFQRVTDASIRPVLDEDRFTPIHWNNAPTRIHDGGIRRQVLNLLDARYAPPQVILPAWQDFATTMKHVRNFIFHMCHVQPPPASLLECFKVLNASPGTLKKTDLEAYVTQNGNVWTDKIAFRGWAEQVLDGCFGTPSAELRDTFKSLYADIFDPPLGKVETVALVVPPASTSKNATIYKGVPHCLIYGYDGPKTQAMGRSYSKYVDDKDSDLVISTDEEEYKDSDEDAERQEGPDQGRVNRGRPEKRVILSKSKREYGKRSRSRSPSSGDDNVVLPLHVISIAPRPAGGHTIQTMIANPDHYYLESKSYFKFFEPHKPDLVCRADPVVVHVKAKFVCEIASWLKEGRNNVSLPKLVEESTEQCVQSALAALAYDQKHIMGIVVVPDGMKVIQIKKKRRHYKIHETPLVLWSEERKLFVLLEMIRKVLV